MRWLWFAIVGGLAAPSASVFGFELFWSPSGQPAVISRAITADPVEVLLWVRDTVSVDHEQWVTSVIQGALREWEDVPTAHIRFTTTNIRSATQPASPGAATRGRGESRRPDVRKRQPAVRWIPRNLVWSICGLARALPIGLCIVSHDRHARAGARDRPHAFNYKQHLLRFWATYSGHALRCQPSGHAHGGRYRRRVPCLSRFQHSTRIRHCDSAGNLYRSSRTADVSHADGAHLPTRTR